MKYDKGKDYLISLICETKNIRTHSRNVFVVTRGRGGAGEIGWRWPNGTDFSSKVSKDRDRDGTYRGMDS